MKLHLSVVFILTLKKRLGEAPWSNGEHQGLRIRAMVLGSEFKSRLHLKTRWKDTEYNKDSQMRQVTSKKNIKKPRLMSENSLRLIIGFFVCKTVIYKIRTGIIPIGGRWPGNNKTNICLI